MSTSNINKNCKITNNSGKDIVVIDAYESSKNSTAEMYEQNHLDILETTDQQKVIKTGTTGTVLLDDYFEDEKGKTEYKTIYNLIIAQSEDIFPVISVGEMLGFVDPTYPPITASEAEAKNMKLAETFHQEILAFPTSNMSKDFQVALSGSQQKSSTTGDIDSSMSGFFAKYPQFKSLGLNNVVAINTYYGQFANIWANYKASYTYYLYSGDGSKITAQGKIEFKKTGTANPADTKDHNGGYTITYIDHDNKQTTLYYLNGQLVSDKTLAIPPICLQGIFMLKSTLSHNSKDNVLIPVMSGKVNGTKVMGTNEEKTIHSSLWVFFHPKSFQAWLGLISSLVGILFALQFAVSGLKSLYDRINRLVDKYQGKEPPKSDIEKLRDELKAERVARQEDAQKLLDKFDEQLKVPENLDPALEQTKAKIKEILQEDQKSVLEDNLKAQASKLHELAEYGVDENIEEIAEDLRQSLDDLNDASPEELGDVIAEVKGNLKDINTKLGNEEERLSEELTEETKQALETQNAKIQESEEISEEIDKSLDGLDDGEVPEDIDPME